MSKQQFPPGWDEARVKKLLQRYEQMQDDELIAEDEAAAELQGQTVMIIPTQYVSAVRELIERKTSA
ncbi:MAG TPA: hypothetical protein V6C86_03565 [Oculatellaceae cyanobacterium]